MLNTRTLTFLVLGGVVLLAPVWLALRAPNMQVRTAGYAGRSIPRDGAASAGHVLARSVPALVAAGGHADPAQPPRPLVDGNSRTCFQAPCTLPGAPSDLDGRQVSTRLKVQANGSTLPRVSVVMPAYNAAETLVASMDSVLGQSHRELELLVIDDRSSDATWELAQEAARRDPRVVPIQLGAHGGVAVARNTGIEAATGSHIAFLDSDDRWHPDKLATQLVAMARHQSPVSYTAYQRVSADGRVLSTVRPPIAVDHATMLKGNHIGNLTGLYARHLGEMRFQSAGHEDYVFWLKLVRLAGHAICAGQPDPLAYYLVRSGSLSANKFRAVHWQWRIYREIENIGPMASTWYLLNYAAGALAKRM